MRIPWQKHPCGKGWRAFFPSKSGKFQVSVVAGEYFYSSPRKDIETTGYKSVEVAIFDESNDFIKPKEIEHIVQSNDDVFGFVPVENVQKIWELL